MNKWNYEVNIKQYLSDMTTWETLEYAAHGIAKEFKNLPEELFADEWSIQDDIEFLGGVSAEFDPEVYDSPYDLQDEINYRLNNLYDFADANRIWCSL